MKKGKLWWVSLVMAMTLLSFSSMGQADIKTLLIPATEDSYIVTDIADTDDAQGFRERNYGDLEFLKTWYAWGVVGEERLVSIDLVKFDLSELEGKEVESAVLQLYARTANLKESARLVDIHRIREAWQESTVTFENRPSWDPIPVATAAIYGAGGWYSWNITANVVEGIRNGEVSVAVALRSVAEESEEQVVFVSTEGGTKAPRLMVTVEADVINIPLWVWVVMSGLGVVILVVGYIALRRTRSGPSS